MSVTKEFNFRWYDASGKEIQFLITIDSIYDAEHGSLRLDQILGLRFDDAYGAELDWTEVNSTFRPTLIDAIELAADKACEDLSMDSALMLDCHADYTAGLADNYERED